MLKYLKIKRKASGRACNAMGNELCIMNRVCFRNVRHVELYIKEFDWKQTIERRSKVFLS